MSVGRFLQQGAAGNAGGATYVDDVFSTYLYAGNSTERDIQNGLDLSGEGGLVWIKDRASGAHTLSDTENGANKYLSSSSTAALTNSIYNEALKAFNSDGFKLPGYVSGDPNKINGTGYEYVSWTFRKQPGFFDVVTYTGNGTPGRTVSHNLGSVPGMIIIKCRDSSGSDPQWFVYHRSTGSGKKLLLNSDAAMANTSVFNNTDPTSTEFTVGNSGTNTNNATYVAYLFAHDAQEFGTNSDESIIKCGTFTGNPVTVDLGWEPQWILLKKTDGSNDWFIYDTMRGWQTDGTGSYLQANNTIAEVFTSLEITKINSTGVEFVSYGGTWIYVAIRRPHKPASEFAATDLFAIDTRNSTGDGQEPGFRSGFPVDMNIFNPNVTSSNAHRISGRLTGNKYLESSSTNAELLSLIHI